jgi:hypothetical protein
MAGLTNLKLLTDFFNKIGPQRPFATLNSRTAKDSFDHLLGDGKYPW